MKTVGLLGYGAIGEYVAARWSVLAPRYRLVSVFGRSHRLRTIPEPLLDGCECTDDADRFLAIHTDVVVEAVGHEVSRRLVPALLEQGRAVYLLSVGILADDDLAARLDHAARSGGGELRIPAGALAGFDGLQALTRAGEAVVRYVSRKPPVAWRNTPAEARCDLDALREPVVFFEGTAREAARLFPKNVNLGAAVALAGVGLDATRVALVADPTVTENVGAVEAKGAIGTIEITVSGGATPGNPKTSTLAAASVVSALLRDGSPVRFV